MQISENMPGHYLVEFSDETGAEIATVDLTPEQFEVIWSFAKNNPKESQPPEQTQESIGRNHFERGLLYLNNGLISQAKEEFRRAFAINPNYAGDLLNAAKPLAEEGNWDAAIQACRFVLSLQPDRLTARDNLAVSFRFEFPKC